MERDFMGLAVKVKQEVPDEIIDAAPVRSSVMQWSFSNKGAAPSRVLSFQGAKEDKLKTGFDALTSAGLVTITTSEAYDADNKSYPGVLQKNAVPENQVVGRFSANTYPMKHSDSHAIHRTINNQTNVQVSPAASNSIHQSFVFNSPVPSAGHSNSPVVGTTDLRNGTKVSGAPAQLTIFYNGSVCVYDNVSSEKAQAIMLLAGNGPLAASTTPPPAAPVQAPAPRMSSVLDGIVVSQPYAAKPRHSSPVNPINSINISHSAGRNNDVSALKQAGNFLSSSNMAEPVKVVNPIRSVPPTLLSSDTVPQSRRKSLARFLEKRKERATTASPYADKQSPECSTHGAGSTSLSVNSSGSCPVPAVN